MAGWTDLIAPIAGAVLGNKGSKSTETTTKTTDPRYDPYLYGYGGILPSAANWYSQNSSGLNDQSLLGLNNQWSQLGASKPGFDQMQSLGQTLMGGSVAGNPFTNGAMANGGKQPAGSPTQSTMGSYQPAQYGGSQAFSMPKAQPMAAPSSNLGIGNYGVNYGGSFQPGDAQGGGMGATLGGGFSDAQMAQNAAAVNAALQSAYNSQFGGTMADKLGLTSFDNWVSGLLGNGGLGTNGNDGNDGNDPGGLAGGYDRGGGNFSSGSYGPG